MNKRAIILLLSLNVLLGIWSWVTNSVRLYLPMSLFIFSSMLTYWSTSSGTRTEYKMLRYSSLVLLSLGVASMILLAVTVVM